VAKSVHNRDFCFSILTKVKNYILVANDEKEYKEWLQNLQNEVQLYQSKK